MPSDADNFETDLESFEEFVDDEGRHFYAIQFKDGSGRLFQKQPSKNEHSVAEFTVRNGFAMEGMRMISSATNFEVDENANTQQNLRNLMQGQQAQD